MRVKKVIRTFKLNNLQKRSHVYCQNVLYNQLGDRDAFYALDQQTYITLTAKLRSRMKRINKY